MAKGGFFESLKKIHDELEVSTAAETIGTKVEVLSTGSPTLDDKLFCGGIPYGRVTQFYGEPGSGKTLCSMLLIKEAQKKNKKSKQLWLDAEGTFSPEWAKSLGLDLKRITVIDSGFASDCKLLFEMLLGVPKVDAKKHYSGKSQPGFLDAVAAKEEDYNLIVLDSLGQMVAPMEQTSEVGKQNIGAMSRFISVEFKKLTVDLKKANIPFVVINHVSNRIGEMFPVSEFTSSGGNRLKHSLSVNIFFMTLRGKDNTILNAANEKMGHVMRAKIEKNKFGPWPRQAEFTVDFSKGIINIEEEIAELAINYGIIERPTNTSYIYKEVKYVGREKLLTALRETPSLTDELMQKVVVARESTVNTMILEQSKLNEEDDSESEEEETNE